MSNNGEAILYTGDDLRKMVQRQFNRIGEMFTAQIQTQNPSASPAAVQGIASQMTSAVAVQSQIESLAQILIQSGIMSEAQWYVAQIIGGYNAEQGFIAGGSPRLLGGLQPDDFVRLTKTAMANPPRRSP